MERSWRKYGVFAFAAAGWALAAVSLSDKVLPGPRGSDEAGEKNPTALPRATDFAGLTGPGPQKSGRRRAKEAPATQLGGRTAEEELAECYAQLAMHLGVPEPWPDSETALQPEDVELMAHASLVRCLDGLPFSAEIDCSEYPCMVWVISPERLDKRLFCDAWELEKGSLSYQSGVAVGDGLEAVQFAVMIPGADVGDSSSNAERRWDFRTDASEEWVFEELRERLTESTASRE